MNIIKSKYYYERKIPDDYFESIIVSEALLTKKDLRTKYMDIFADNIDHISKKQLKSVTSSGTTGEPITVYWSPVDLVKSNIELWRLRNQYYNITPLCKQISFDTGNMTLGSEIRMVDKYHMLINKFFVSEENMEQIYNAFVEYDPEWILVQPSLELLKKISFNPILLSSENYEMSIGDSPTVRIIGVPLDFFTYTEGLNSESEAFWKTFTALFPVNCLITVLYSDIEYITQFKEMKVISEKVFGRSSDLFLCRKNCSGFVEKSLTEGNLLNIDDEGTDIIYRVIKSLHINLSSIE